MYYQESDYIPPLSEQMANYEDPFIDALLDGPLFNSHSKKTSASRSTKHTMPAGKNARKEKSMATKTKNDYTPAERAAYNMGRGSTFSRSEEGRKKHVTKMFNGDKKLIASYKHGRQRGLADKKAYLEKVKQARKNK